MNYWLYAVILAFVLSISGIGESQTRSKFPKVDIRNAIGVEFRNCNDVIYSITVYSKENDLEYLVYKIGNLTFAILEFNTISDKAIAVYLLQPNQSVLKFEQSEFAKIGGPCQTIKTLKLRNDHNTF